MLKVLHTADWHVGRTLHRRHRLSETREVLAEIAEIAEREHVDLVLVCGDLFEHHAPTGDAEQVAYDGLVALRDAGAEVLVTCGNHDNPRRLAAIESPFRAAGIEVVPTSRAADAGGVIEVHGRDGTRGQVACLPWVPEHRLYDAGELMGSPESPFDSYAQRLTATIAGLCSSLDPTTATIFAGHLSVCGAKLGGGDDRAARELTMGEVFAVPPASLPAGVQYIALGHIHRPQQLPTVTPARYAGSPMALDFGEVDQDKSVTLVEIEPGRPARLREIPVSAGRPLRDVRGTLDELAAQRDTLTEVWLRVTIECEGPTPGLADRIREILPSALVIRPEYPRQDDQDDPGEDLRHLTGPQLFDRYYRTVHLTTPDLALAALFADLYEEVAGEAA